MLVTTMQQDSKKEILRLGEDFPKITVGSLLPHDGVLITGHESGLLLKWDLATRKHSIIRQCESAIETISTSPQKEVAVGCHSGLLFTFHLDAPDKVNIVQEASSSVFSRIWRSTWYSHDTLVTTSTYGKMKVWQKLKDEWTSIELSGHRDSIFGLASYRKFIASGDYRGNILIWESDKEKLREIDRLKTLSNIQGVAWSKDESLVTVETSGRIRFFEIDQKEKKWKSVFVIDAASNRGNCIHLTEDAKSIFAGTDSEIIQFDFQTQQIQQISSAPVKSLFSTDTQVFVLTDNTLEVFQRSEVEVPISLVRYQYAKVSLVGHTGVGKSTFCNNVVGKDLQQIKSTVGKKVWTWTIEPSTDPPRRIIFHDHGGQETVLGTFLPFLTDSDLILVFFQQNDEVTFDKAVAILEEIRSVISAKTKIFLVKTYIDQISEVSDSSVDDLLKKEYVANCLEACPPSGQGIEQIKKMLTHAVSWQKAKTMFRSKTVENLTKVIMELAEQNRTVVPLRDVKSLYEKSAGLTISTSHLQFVLANFSDQGLIEYYPMIVDEVIFNDDQYNRLRSEIPFYVNEKKGIVPIDKILKKFKPLKYVEILDRVYQSIGVSIKNQDLRIFPANLHEGSVKIPDAFKKVLAESPRHVSQFPLQYVSTAPIISALSELNMRCVDASKTEGIFSWEKNAFVYYLLREFGDEVGGRGIEIAYYVGGKKMQIKQRLEKEFKAIIEHLYGPSLKLTRK